MTQAPTPGPLSVGDRVFAVADLRQTPNGSVWIKKGEEAVIVGELGVNNCLAIVLASNGNEGTWAKTCFRLAPTAPVEASGSELADALERVDRWANYEYTYEDTVAVGSPLSTFTAGDLRLILAALRPQPSGETRPTDEELRSAIKATEYKYFGDYEFSEEQHAAVDVLVRAAQALLSARPLALGGQQGAGEWERTDKLASALSELMPAVRAYLMTGDVMSQSIKKNTWEPVLKRAQAALSTTPARAEASGQ